VFTHRTCETEEDAMKMRLTSLTVIAVLMSMMVLVPLGAEAQTQTFPVKNDLKNIPVVGEVTGGTFEGKLTILGFTVGDGGALSATGVLDGVVTSSTGLITRIRDQAFTNVLANLGPNEPGVCDILFLDLGPISLDLLGLTVELSRILLDVDAVPGEGNLLGNLLCAIANLLNP
jgi:hypothetical protein